jgi:hypothetical protein
MDETSMPLNVQKEAAGAPTPTAKLNNFTTPAI